MVEIDAVRFLSLLCVLAFCFFLLLLFRTLTCSLFILFPFWRSMCVCAATAAVFFPLSLWLLFSVSTLSRYTKLQLQHLFSAYDGSAAGQTDIIEYPTSTICSQQISSVNYFNSILQLQCVALALSLLRLVFVSVSVFILLFFLFRFIVISLPNFAASFLVLSVFLHSNLQCISMFIVCASVLFIQFTLFCLFVFSSFFDQFYI